MQFQYDFVGGPIPQNQGWLRCPRCITPLTYQRKLLIIPPDPPPLFNTRPEPYVVDETNWLTSGDDNTDGDIIVSGATSGTGDAFITAQPNPADVANTTILVLTASLSYTGTLSVAYLDLFNGEPAGGGTSILATITGSATRSNVFADLEADGNLVLENPDLITVTSASEAVCNVSHVGIYSAASDGTLLTSGPLGATYPTIALGTAVQFNGLGLRIAQV